jgi:PPOX class probable F420-dependent enzyme
MASKRDQIKMSEEELIEFLAGHRVMTCATIGPNDRPHLMPLWYVPQGTELRSWTYAASQKAKNLERDPRATIQVEDGELYHELRGAMMECDVHLDRDPESVAEYGWELFARFAPDGELTPEVREMVQQQAAKRVGLRFMPTRIVTWDHAKLGGTY